jgi:hypothetical protein
MSDKKRLRKMLEAIKSAWRRPVDVESISGRIAIWAIFVSTVMELLEANIGGVRIVQLFGFFFLGAWWSARLANAHAKAARDE